MPYASAEFSLSVPESFPILLPAVTECIFISGATRVGGELAEDES